MVKEKSVIVSDDGRDNDCEDDGRVTIMVICGDGQSSDCDVDGDG